MKKIFFIAAIAMISCNNKKEENTPATDVKKENTVATPETGNPSTAPATTAVEKLPAAKKTGVNIDKNPQFTVDGSQISRVSYKGEKGNSTVDEMYYIQKADQNITLTQVQVTRGEGAGLSKSVYIIDVTKVNAADLKVEEVKDKRYPKGVFYLINISCKDGANCMSHDYEDIGIGKPVNRTETLTQISFEKKEDAEKYVAIIKNNLQ